MPLSASSTQTRILPAAMEASAAGGRAAAPENGAETGHEQSSNQQIIGYRERRDDIMHAAGQRDHRPRPAPA